MTDSNVDQPVFVDPRAPRFGQAVTAFVLTAGIALQEPALIATVALVLGTAVVSLWRLDVYGLVWKTAAIPVVGRPDHREAASPHRFAKLIGAVGTTLATAFFVAGAPVAGYGLAGVVAGAAGFAAVSGICLGCRMYRQVSFARRIGIV